MQFCCIFGVFLVQFWGLFWESCSGSLAAFLGQILGALLWQLLVHFWYILGVFWCIFSVFLQYFFGVCLLHLLRACWRLFCGIF